MSGIRHVPSHVLLVTVDDATLHRHAGEPLAFYGPYFARAVALLREAGAKVIGFDFLFAVSAEAWLRKLGASTRGGANFDAPFRQQLHEGDVVLAGIIDDTGDVRLPIMDYQAVLPGFPAVTGDVGLVNVFIDDDGVTRSFVMTPFESAPSGQPTPARLLSFAPLLAVRASGQDPSADAWRFAGKAVRSSPTQRRIGFTGPPGTIPRLSLARLLDAGTVDDDLRAKVDGRVVIVGLDHAADQDIHSTPYSRSLFISRGQDMNGAELHANIVETLLAGTGPVAAPVSARVACTLVLLLAGAFLFRRLQPWQGLGAGFALAAAAALVSFAAFGAGLEFVPGQTQAALTIAYLATLGLRLTEEERQRAQLRGLFGRYVSDDIVESLLARADRPDLDGEETRATILFSDIRNFSVYSEALGPKETMRMLNAHWARVCEPILEQGGTIYSFAGDQVFAVFGAPIPHDDHAARAVRAALEVQRITRAYGDESEESFKRMGLPPFRVGVGLNTGNVLVGSMGFSRRTTYTAIGETTNTASRLESLNKRLGWDVIASVETARAAGDGIEVGRSMRVEVAGRREPVDVVEVTGFHDRA